jgi:hypothetical protein
MRVQTKTLPLWSHRYRVLLAIALLAAALIHVPSVNAETVKKPIAKPMVVYKSPSCGCCGAWVDHMEQEGFSTTIKHPNDLNSIKQQLGIAPAYQACHTATLQGYAFEGHIPADVIRRFLAAKPADAVGLAVPGMPMGSPGMDTNRKYRPYQVLQLNKDGSSTPYAAVSANKTIYMEKKP